MREPLERVERIWRGIVMDTYALEKLTGWTPELSPPPDTPLYRWRVLAGDVGPAVCFAALGDDDVRMTEIDVIPGRVEGANYDVQLHIAASREFRDAQFCRPKSRAVDVRFGSQADLTIPSPTSVLSLPIRLGLPVMPQSADS